MSLTRWDPFEDMLSLRDAMNQLFEESFIRPRRLVGGNGSRFYRLPVDVYETPEEFAIEAVIPGLAENEINIEFQNGNLIISGEMPATEHENATYHLRERWYGTFRRVLTLPGSVDADNIEATLDHGILTVHVPKAEEAKPRRIAVKTTA